jgi:hypothetical protein
VKQRVLEGVAVLEKCGIESLNCVVDIVAMSVFADCGAYCCMSITVLASIIVCYRQFLFCAFV